MASPFKIFRKYQKTLLAVAGVILMIVFTLGGVISGVGGGPGYTDPIVVRTKYGDFSERDLERMAQLHNVTIGFLNEVVQLRARAEGRNPRQEEMFGGQVTPRGALVNLLTVEKAKELGIVVSDQMVNQWIEKRLTQRKVAASKMRELLGNRSFAGRRLTMNQVFEEIRQRIARETFEMTYLASAQPTPAQLWERFKQLNDRVRIEALPVEVADLLDEAEEPTEAEIVEFYNQYKNVTSLPIDVAGQLVPSPEPGFRRPPRMALSYVKADFGAVVDEEADAISDEAIAQYYEENKEEFVKTTLLEDPLSQPTPELGEPSPEVPGPPEPKVPADPGAASSTTEPGAPGPPEPKVSTEPEQSKPQGESAKPQQPALPGPPEPKPENDGQAPKADDGAATLEIDFGNTQFVSLLDEEATADTEAKPAGEDASEAKQQDADTSAAADRDAQENDESPAQRAAGANETSSPAANKSADGAAQTAPVDESNGKQADGSNKSKEKPEKAAAAATDASGAETASPGEDEDSVEENPVEYRPLDEVADEIRRNLARVAARDKIDEMLEPVRSTIFEYSIELRKWEAEESETRGSRPQPPHLESLAAGPALQFGETGLVTFYQLAQQALGKTYVPSERGAVLARHLFGLERLRKYQPVEAEDDAQNRYLVWKTDQAEPGVPDLNAIRDEVVQAWKTIRARELAEERAESLATSARELGKPLRDCFPEQEIIETGPFSWYSGGDMMAMMQQQPIRLSRIDGIPGADHQFMEQAFNLDVGEVTVAMDASHSTVYVIRLIEHAQSTEALRMLFQGRPGPWLRSAAQSNFDRLREALIAELYEDATVIWETDELSSDLR